MHQKYLKQLIILVLLLTLSGLNILCTQQAVDDVSISQAQVDAHIKYLASDDLKGRDPFSEDIHMAEDYIAMQFREAGLKAFDRFPDYRHTFTHLYRDRRNPDDPGTEYTLTNIVGYLEGLDPKLKDEFLIFGAHHDHLGIGGNGEDTIYNGAEDNASGTTAIIALADYFAAHGDNNRSIIFITFSAEERGMIGSHRFVQDLPVEKDQIVAMINFEMIGKPSDDGKPVCYVTGWNRSDLGEILQKSVSDAPLQIIHGPEITDRLFFASDNISFARAGIVAHTIAGIQSTGDSLTHHVDDEYETLDIANMTAIICGVATASQSLISGKETPRLLQPVE